MLASQKFKEISLNGSRHASHQICSAADHPNISDLLRPGDATILAAYDTGLQVAHRQSPLSGQRAKTRRWVLSGTPPIHDFASLKTIAAFLDIHLGVDDDGEGQSEQIKKRRREQTGACFPFMSKV